MRLTTGILLAFLLSTPIAAQTIGVVDGPAVSINNNSAIITGWTFNAQGAAILKLRAWFDCNPFARLGCSPFQFPNYYFNYQRPDVVAAYPAFQVPENTGFFLGIFDWFSIPDGNHWIYAGVVTAGIEGWTQINPVCFRKWGGNVQACQ